MEDALLNEDYNDALQELDDCKREALSLLEEIDLQEAYLDTIHNKGKISDLIYAIDMARVRRCRERGLKVLKIIQSKRTEILYYQHMS